METGKRRLMGKDESSTSKRPESLIIQYHNAVKISSVKKGEAKNETEKLRMSLKEHSPGD